MYAKPTILMILVIFLLIVHGAWGMYQKSQTAKEKRDKAQAHLHELKSREKELSDDIIDLSTDRGIEGEIRDRFMVAKPGESFIVVVDPEEKKVHTVTVPDDKQSLIGQIMSAVGLSN